MKCLKFISFCLLFTLSSCVTITYNCCENKKNNITNKCKKCKKYETKKDAVVINGVYWATHNVQIAEHLLLIRKVSGIITHGQKLKPFVLRVGGCLLSKN